MPSWSELNNEFAARNTEQRQQFLSERLDQYTAKVAALTDRNVLFYASSFLQKPQVAGVFSSVNAEDLNGFMAGVHRMDFSKGLLLMLHTPGGSAEAAESIVEYLWSKFPSVTALVPTYAMSAGTMIALGCDSVIMGRQSQLGPTDPQLIINNRNYSAHSLVTQFEDAKKDIIANVALAHAWAPVLQQFGPAILQEARRSLQYGKNVVAEWLERHMFHGDSDAAAKAHSIVNFFSDESHGSHGRRIGRDEARHHGVMVEDLEANQDLQDAALSLYHTVTLAFEHSPAAKTVISSNGGKWFKNIVIQPAQS